MRYVHEKSVNRPQSSHCESSEDCKTYDFFLSLSHGLLILERHYFVVESNFLNSSSLLSNDLFDLSYAFKPYYLPPFVKCFLENFNLIYNELFRPCNRWSLILTFIISSLSMSISKLKSFLVLILCI